MVCIISSKSSERLGRQPVRPHFRRFKSILPPDIDGKTSSHVGGGAGHIKRSDFSLQAPPSNGPASTLRRRFQPRRPNIHGSLCAELRPSRLQGEAKSTQPPPSTATLTTLTLGHRHVRGKFHFGTHTWRLRGASGSP